MEPDVVMRAGSCKDLRCNDGHKTKGNFWNVSQSLEPTTSVKLKITPAITKNAQVIPGHVSRNDLWRCRNYLLVDM